MGRKLGRGATGLPRYYMDTGWWRGRRFAGLPLDAIGLMSCIVGYCTEHATDGHVPADPEDLAAALGVRASHARKALRPLIERGILDENDGELVVRGWEELAPEVACKRSTIPPGMRRRVIERDGLTCQICGGPVEPDDIHLDHVVPVVAGGQNHMKNLRVTHSLCNLRKGASR